VRTACFCNTPEKETFETDICIVPGRLFTGLPSTLQNLPLVKHGGAAGGGPGWAPRGKT
jgi:hypothetical protein